MSGFQSDLLTGLAVYLAAQGIGTWNTSGIYTAAQTGILLGTLPSTPDRIVSLNTYAVRDSANLSDSIIGVQVRCRWGGQDPRSVDDLADLIFNLLHGATSLTLSTGVRVVQCLRNSAGPLGQDSNGRWSNVQNFYCSVHRPSTNRT